LAEWHAEGAAFFLEPFEYEPEDEAPEATEDRLRYEADRKACIAPLVKQVESMPPEELCRLVRLKRRMRPSRPASCWRMPLTSPMTRWPTLTSGPGAR